MEVSTGMPFIHLAGVDCSDDGAQMAACIAASEPQGRQPGVYEGAESAPTGIYP